MTNGPTATSAGGHSTPPVDAADGPRLALAGQIVTMDEHRTVLKNGVIYLDKGAILAVQERTAPPPADFATVPITETNGTIYPGLIDLHNHLSYNILQLWDVPKQYHNRGQWAGIPEYRNTISGPMQIIGQTPGMLASVVRYVECKCLVGGVTTSQGIELFSNHGARRYYRGLVRNVEQTNDPALPEAGSRIADVDATDAQSFLARLGQKQCYLLHLAEGIDDSARKHFLSLQIDPQVDPDKWAITASLTGIHSTALHAEDYAIMAKRGASMVWSPFSNLLLYGGTARVSDARAAGVAIGLGADWSPSGSKSLFGELKVARVVTRGDQAFDDKALLAMATIDAAKILHWEHLIGSIEAGKRADLMVIAGKPADPYGTFFETPETGVTFVLINGVPRFGTSELFQSVGLTGDTIKLDGQMRRLNLAQANNDPDVGAVSFDQARDLLTQTLNDLPNLANAAPKAIPFGVGAPVQWFLALDELAPTGIAVRPNLPFDGQASAPAALGVMPLAAPELTPLKLDALTVVDDARFLDVVRNAKNLPAVVKSDLPGLYGG
jgi:5-methylthioadenosine/S-adenosylhomocysteine deaminase